MIIGEDFKWNKIMKRILILDFDGTIIDSNYVKENSIIEYIKDNYGINIFNLIDEFWDQKNSILEITTSDEILSGCLVTHKGEFVNSIVKERFS